MSCSTKNFVSYKIIEIYYVENELNLVKNIVIIDNW